MNTKQYLHGTWQWHSTADSAQHNGIVPGTVLADMLQNNLVKNPFWRTNEYAVRELFMHDYTYSHNFQIEQQALQATSVQLVFEGLDTLANIWLNGTLLARTSDMHRTYRFEVKNYLQIGKNHIQVTLEAPLAFVRNEDADNDIFYASTGCIQGNAALRKAHYMFGWDWGPQLPDAGIFRPVYLEFIRTARISAVHIHQSHSENTVALNISTEITQYTGNPLHLQTTITAPNGKVTQAQTPVQGTTSLQLTITNPLLWWPNGLGAQPLYTVKTSLFCGKNLLDVHQCRIGLRTITVSTQPDEWGSEFAVVVNGIKIFAMGANYIPQDNILPHITPQRIRTLVADCASANFNMLRVWGGGYYPDTSFYDACDEHGILVWQDLMFACNVYALDKSGSFEENIVAETRDNIRRLKNHACIALWCGNNEMEWGWGDEWQRIKGHHPRYKADYIKIFEHILPRVVKQEAPDIFWWPSSPSSGGDFYKPNSPDCGDQHYWEVWHSGKPFTEYRAAHFRFCSEYGFQSFPHIKSIKSFTLPQDRNIFTEVMESHQKNGAANSKIFAYIADYFLYPKNMDSIAYISQVLQLKAIQYGVEHWRQNRGRCMGSLYWQLNDCWPVASWASIDYYGRWKALHYGARKFYAPVMASACETYELSSEITYYVHNDTKKTETALLIVELVDTAFTVLYRCEKEVVLPALSAQPVLTVNFAPYLTNAQTRKQAFAKYRLIQNGQTVSQGTTLFVKPKHFTLPNVEYTSDIAPCDTGFTLHLKASNFSYYTEIYFTGCDPLLSDNFFDITGAEGVQILIDKQRLPNGITAQDLMQQMVVRSVKNSYITEGESAACN